MSWRDGLGSEPQIVEEDEEHPSIDRATHLRWRSTERERDRETVTDGDEVGGNGRDWEFLER